MRPFLKWAGGKYRLVKRITEVLPSGSRLVEPFSGSCAVSLNTCFDEYWLNDINPDLIHLYQIIQQEGYAFIEYCQSFFTPRNNCADRYYLIRDQFNQEKDIYLKSALFIYLNRHGYNGLSRYNSRGEFNVPFGKHKKPYFPEAELKFFYTKLKNARFTCLDFEKVMLSAKTGDVIYCDPPYTPLNRTSNFTAYSTGGFDHHAQLRLARVAESLRQNGIKTVISNHYNEYIIKIYRRAKLTKFPVQRLISCDGSQRNKVDEVLAVFD